MNNNSSPDDIHPGLSSDQKDILNEKLAYLESLERDLSSGSLEGNKADQELAKTLAEVEEIMEEGRRQQALLEELEKIKQV